MMWWKRLYSCYASLIILCAIIFFVTGCSFGSGNDDDGGDDGGSNAGTEGLRAYVVSHDPSTSLGLVTVISCATNMVETIILSVDLLDADNIAATPDGNYVHPVVA